MTVKQMIEALSKLPPEAEVVVWDARAGYQGDYVSCEPTLWGRNRGAGPSTVEMEF